MPEIRMDLSSRLMSRYLEVSEKPLSPFTNSAWNDAGRSWIWSVQGISRCRDTTVGVNDLGQGREGKGGGVAGRRDQAER
jgi:hypothetical protein